MKLTIFKDNRQLSEIDLGKEIEGNNGSPVSFWLGRSKDCHVVLDDMQVSREHAELKFDGAGWYIKKSTQFNNLLVNGTYNEERKLSNGDVISIGPFIINIELDELAAAASSVVDTKPLEENVEGDIDDVLEDDETETVVAEDSDFEDMDGELGDIDDDLGEGMGDDLDSLDDSDGDLDGDEAIGEVTQEIGDGEEFEASGEDESFGGEGDFEESDGFDDSEGFGDDDEYAMEASDDESTRVIQAFSKFSLDIFGEHAPYDSFIVEANETFIGRDPEKCQIVLSDPEVSGVHAVIKKTKISATLEDLQSGNGTILNGERINKHELVNGDEFIIGSTTFTVKVTSDFLQQEQDRLMPVEENQVVEVEEIVEIDENFEDEDGNLIEGGDGFDASGIEEEDKSLMGKIKPLFDKNAWRDPQKRKKNIIYSAVIIVLLMLLMPTEEPKKVTKKAPKKKDEKKLDQVKGKKLKPEDLEFVDSTYQLARELFSSGKYQETIFELDKVFQKTEDYKQAKALYQAAKDGLKKLEELENQRREKEARAARKLKVKELLKKAEVAVKERRVEYAESLFSEISQLDPENIEVTQLKLELDAYKKEQEKIALEKAAKEAERKRQVEAVQPGKAFYNQKEWYKAIKKLDALLLKEKSLDDDLMKEATSMLAESRSKLEGIIQPLLGKARSLKEGQDLKGSYENYLQVLKYDPGHVEALNEMDEIRQRLTNRSRKIYREAIISESLSLFDDAKEKFQEVQQVSPTDSEYYQKATAKLKEYLD